MATEGRTFSGMRLYARELEAVAELAEHLREQGLDVVTRAKDIETMQGIERVLSFFFLVGPKG